MAVSVVSGSAALGQVVEPLTLRVADAEGVPGGEVAVVIRTYASRGVGRGQIGLHTVAPAGLVDGMAVAGTTSPFASFLGATVFAAEGDAEVDKTDFDPTGQTLNLLFSSLTGSINALDGPLAVLRFTLASDLQPGSTYAMDLMPGAAFLEDGEGNPIVIDLRGGELTVLAPGSALAIEGEGDLDPWIPGEAMPIGPSTSAVQPIGTARFALRYAPSTLSRPLVVRLDPRYGNATIDHVAEPEPGLVVVDVSSPDGSYGMLPGLLVEVEAWISPCDIDASSLTIDLDPTLTRVFAPGGQEVLLAEIGSAVPRLRWLRDGFESGDSRRWCASP